MTSSIRTTVHESLPYIDKEPTQAERKAAEAQITTEAKTNPPNPPIPPIRDPTFTPTIQKELERIKRNEPLNAIDQSRYEQQDPFPPSPSSHSPSSQSQTNQNKPDYETPLKKAYKTSTYLTSRKENLSLLDSYGKTAWLTSNWQTEAELASLERDLAAQRKEIDLLAIRRRRLQDDVADELSGLEEAWKKSVSRVLETEIATEALRQRVREMQRGSG